MKKFIGAMGVVILIFLAVYLTMRNDGEEKKYATRKVERGDIRSVVTATGTVNAVTTVQVGTQVSGTIKILYADFNSYVKKGQLLAQIDPAAFEGQVNQAKANVLAARANVKKAEAALLDASRQLSRNKELFARRLIARSDLDTAETNEMAAAAQVEAAKAQVGQATAALGVAEINLLYTRIVSPVDGMVISRNVDVGQTVAASFQTPTLFTIAQDLSKMQINTSVDEADIGSIRKGQRVEFSVDAYPEKIFGGSVSVIRNAPITVQNVVTYDVVVLVQNPEKLLKPGMTANVSLITAEKKNILKIPNAALRFRFPEKITPRASEHKGPVVWIWDKNKPRRVVFEKGISNGNSTEVLSGDLKEGDEVIVSVAAQEKEKKRSLLSRRLFH